jgi:hypothetical protein
MAIAGMSNQYATLAGNTLPTGVLVLGIFVMMVSLLGCVGAKRESRAILTVVCTSDMSDVFRSVYGWPRVIHLLFLHTSIDALLVKTAFEFVSICI